MDLVLGYPFAHHVIHLPWGVYGDLGPNPVHRGGDDPDAVGVLPPTDDTTISVVAIPVLLPPVFGVLVPSGLLLR